MDTGMYTLILAKEDFKFSAGHFTLFGPEEAELMHGHNYQVGVELVGPNLDDDGLLASFVEVKGVIRELCERLDTQTLVPDRSPYLDIRRDGGQIEIRYRDKVYQLPEEDVLLLPAVNTSIEVLAHLLWKDMVERLDLSHLQSLGVEVSETAGQSCWFRAPIPRP
ncbi:MAG: 6-carboxytetrahydropterin synthase [Acidobacteriota bacterium]